MDTIRTSIKFLGQELKLFSYQVLHNNRTWSYSNKEFISLGQANNSIVVKATIADDDDILHMSVAINILSKNFDIKISELDCIPIVTETDTDVFDVFSAVLSQAEEDAKEHLIQLREELFGDFGL